jgi:acetylornithine deacetylase
MIESIDNAIDEGWPAQIDLLRELIRIPSLTGSERRVQERVALAMSDCGLTVDSWCPTFADVEDHPAYCDDGNALGERPVVVGTWKGSGDGKSLILNGHMDVVPVGDESLWDHHPWEAVIDDERVHGRGSCDMKAGVVAALCAAIALRRTGFEPRGDLFIQSVIGEETGGVGTLATILRGYRADGAVIMEPTGLALAPAGSGALSFRLKVTGKAAHGGLREEGYSALDAFLSLPPSLKALEVRRHKRFKHDLFTADQLAAPLSIGIVKCGDWVSTVPEELIAEGRYGIFPGEDPESARREFVEAVDLAADQDPWLRNNRPQISWFEGQFEAGETSLQDPIVNSLAEAHSSATGTPPEITGVPYGSDLRLFTNHADVSSVLYGAGDVRLAHTVKEYVPLGEVKTLTRVLARLILDWCN